MVGSAVRTHPLSSALDWLNKPVSIAPLVVFRLVFGALMVFSVLRFWYLGWIEDHFINAQFTFKYYGFEWVQVLSPWGMYALHAAMLVGALGILLGWFYRLSALVFFLTFTYVELIDLTYYLNHYYFVSLVAFCMVFVPAHRRFSFDVRRWPGIAAHTVPQWCIAVFKFQIALVYLYAGLAKINHAWLIEAMPLRIWLPANDVLPIIGPVLALPWMPWVFSWAGMLFDCTIVAFLWYTPTRPWAYAAVLVFHLLTGLMFQIGVFPLVMAGVVLLFFSEKWHERVLALVERDLPPAPSTGGGDVIAPPPVEAGGRSREINVQYVHYQLVVPDLERGLPLPPPKEGVKIVVAPAGREGRTVQVQFFSTGLMQSLRGRIMKLTELCRPASAGGKQIASPPPVEGAGGRPYTTFAAPLTSDLTTLRGRIMKLTELCRPAPAGGKQIASPPPLEGAGGRPRSTSAAPFSNRLTPFTATLLALYLAFQILFPWRYLLYPGNLFWTEEGYRFSWRVMLMEKAGTAIFYVKDAQTGREGVVDNGAFLCAHQEKQMAMQPDMILQYARFLAQHYVKQGVQAPSVRAEVYVTLNGRPGQLLINPQIDLTTVADGWQHKPWILPYKY